MNVADKIADEVINKGVIAHKKGISIEDKRTILICKAVRIVNRIDDERLLNKFIKMFG